MIRRVGGSPAHAVLRIVSGLVHDDLAANCHRTGEIIDREIGTYPYRRVGGKSVHSTSFVDIRV